MATRRHKWKSGDHVGSQVCDECGQHRRRPMSAIRRGRVAVADWDYWIDERWQRRATVPSCETFRS